jgi:hypothetical protein
MSTEQEQPSGDSQVQDELDVGTTSNEPNEIELDENGLPVDQAVDDEDELEEDLDGVKVRGKKEAIERLKAERLMQADYTRKTQEAAEIRKAAEAERTQLQQARQFEQQNLDIVADIRSMDREMAQLSQVNLQQLSDHDPVQAQKLMVRMQQLQAARGQAANALTQRHQAFTHAQQQEAARQLEEGQRVLQRDIPGWGPELAQKLTAFALANGYTQNEVAAIRSPAMVRSLYREYQVAEAKKQATKRTPQVQAAPVTRVNSASKTRAVTDPDKLSPEQWLKWRNAQVKR